MQFFKKLENYPAFFISYNSFLGILSALISPFFILFILLLLFLKIQKKIFYIGFFFFILFHLYTGIYFKNFLKKETLPNKITGTYFVMNEKKSPFGRKYLYEGNLTIIEKGKKYKNLKCFLYTKKNERLNYKHIYKITGIVTYIKKNKVKLKLNDYYVIKKKNFSFYETKNLLRKKFISYIHKKYKNYRSSSYIIAIITGETSNKFMVYNFKKKGLLHLLAVSGFHFSFITMFLYFFLKKIMPIKFSLIILSIIILIYFLFLNFSPSICRAFFTAELVIIGKLFSKKTLPFNTLFLALLLNFFINPLCINEVSLHLSFLSVFCIFTFYPLINNFLAKYLLKRNKDDLKKLSSLERISGILINYIRENFAITFAINLCLFPLFLYYFKSITLFLFMYNLIIPPLVLLSIILFSLSLIIPIFFPLSKSINLFTLNIIEKPSYTLDFFLRMKITSTLFITLWVCAIIFVGLIIKIKKDKLNQSIKLEFF